MHLSYLHDYYFIHYQITNFHLYFKSKWNNPYISNIYVFIFLSIIATISTYYVQFKADKMLKCSIYSPYSQQFAVKVLVFSTELMKIIDILCSYYIIWYHWSNSLVIVRCLYFHCLSCPDILFSNLLCYKHSCFSMFSIYVLTVYSKTML